MVALKRFQVSAGIGVPRLEVAIVRARDERAAIPADRDALTPALW